MASLCGLAVQSVDILRTLGAYVRITVLGYFMYTTLSYYGSFYASSEQTNQPIR